MSPDGELYVFTFLKMVMLRHAKQTLFLNYLNTRPVNIFFLQVDN